MSLHGITRQRVGIAPGLSGAPPALERSPPQPRVTCAAS
jgi:hypothetical protein